MKQLISGADTARARLSAGGEFVDEAMERAFSDCHATEVARHARLLFAASAVLNFAFLASDSRFVGTGHFWVAVPARLWVVLLSLACLWAVRRCPTPSGLQRICLAWMGGTMLGVAALVTSHSILALFVLLLLPAIFHLAVPVAFRWAAIFGGACSVILLAGFELFHGSLLDIVGLGIAMATLNCALLLALARSNRLVRLAWMAIEAERTAKEAAAASEALLETLFAASPVPMVVTNPLDSRIVKHNRAWLDLVDAEPADMRKRPIYSFLAQPGDRERLFGLMAGRDVIESVEVEIVRCDGEIRTVILSAGTIEASGETLIVIGFSDITDRKAAEVALELLASTDTLTGLPNRKSFFSMAEGEMARARRTGAQLALLMVDLDQFKAINDTYGHQCGDEVLRAFGAICRSHLNRGDLVGRLGDEEFAVLLTDAGLARARGAAERLRQAVSEMRLSNANASLRATASIGLTWIDPAEPTISAALGRADQALYAAKHAGRNRVEMTDPPIPEQARHVA